MGKKKEKKPRVLTEKEIRRTEIVKQIMVEKEEAGYEKIDLTIDIVFANIMAFVFAIPICAPFVILYFVRNLETFDMFSLAAYFAWIVLLIAAIVVHELIHGLVWGLSAPNHFKSIEFGFIKEMATPYCTCLEPLTKGQYILGSLMPGLVLGLLPMIIAPFTGSFLTLLFGVIMVCGAGGDLTIIMKILTHKTDKTDIIYIDHPTECGLIVFER